MTVPEGMRANPGWLELVELVKELAFLDGGDDEKEAADSSDGRVLFYSQGGDGKEQEEGTTRCSAGRGGAGAVHGHVHVGRARGRVCARGRCRSCFHGEMG